MAVAFGLAWLLVIGLAGLAQGNEAQTGQATIPPVKPHLNNPDFECSIGYYESETNNAPNRRAFIADGWKLAPTEGGPTIDSAHIFYSEGGSREQRCNSNWDGEKISGRDSQLIRARDLERPPDPGKAFDAAVYQQTPATPGGAYSVSGWFLSLCGGSATPSDCPDNVYMAKMLGIDPTGGTDPNASGIVWTENRNNFVDEDGNRIGWSNLRTVATAQATTITVFARIDSPFNHHGNHAFIDAISILRAPIVNMDKLPAVVTGTRELLLSWKAEQSPDVLEIPGGTYELLVDIQVKRPGAADWQDLAVGLVNQESLPFTAACANTQYEFRIRARAEQPPAPPDGASPNQRYPGVWSEPIRVRFGGTPGVAVPSEGEPRLFFPYISGAGC
jgi:hypothetical protein